ncbi:MAG: DNA-processing protein DprA [Lacibacter sp.]
MAVPTDLLYQIALTHVPQIGPVQARILAEHFEDAASIFKAKKQQLEKIEGIGPVRAAAIKSFENFERAEAEVAFVDKHNIRALYLKHADYPQRLLHCYDPPTVLYYKGTANLNSAKIIAVIGTRHNTDYGKEMTQRLLESLAPYQPLVVSGLAFGIDALAHKKALQLQLPTVGVLAHGLDTIYPGPHSNLARDMVAAGGGLLSEFGQGTPPDRHNFPTRNRVVAGMCDATVVIETAPRGGSMITANLAYSYNRDVFAFPGKVTDGRSEGCNQLIQQQKAILLRSGEELARHMGWISQPPRQSTQRQLFVQLEPDEELLYRLLQQQAGMHIDEINQRCGSLSSSAIAAALLTLELKGVVRSLPGKCYSLA